MDAMQRPTHPATKTFMALRIFVNNELNELHNGLELAHQLLTPGGACAAIAFSSLEDRIIKRQFHGIDMNEKLNMTIKHKVRRSQSYLLPPEQLARYWGPPGFVSSNGDMFGFELFYIEDEGQQLFVISNATTDRNRGRLEDLVMQLVLMARGD